jgi:acetyl-CoA/propionyl-CoA carboxylase biotin carboxyl carrier protein
VKASGGGGGRGFRVAADDTELARAWEGSSGEASRYFNNPDVYLEKYLVQPRHIEVQVFGDTHGTVIALGERDCSVQRRHQKLIEESPSPVVTPELRESLLEASENLARSVEYVGAGTIEYLLDQDDAFYFLEMNTRIQVEHTVTEMVTGIDLVKEQLLVASGKPLSFGLKTLAPRGWALECRVNAEDAGRDFAPAPGTITDYREPAGFGVRVDSAMRVGATINPQYDSLIAKVVTWGRDRSEAISRMERCLREYVIEGVPTTIPFLLNVMADAAFRIDGASTTFVQDRPELLPEPASPTVASEDGVPQREQLVVEVNGQRFDVVMTRSTTGENSGTGPRTRKKPRLSGSRSTGSRDASSGDDVVSPIQGTAIRVDVEEGASVEQGDVIAVVEAMKMENELAAHQAGVIASLNIQVGDSIKVGDIVATIQPD